MMHYQDTGERVCLNEAGQRVNPRLPPGRVGIVMRHLPENSGVISFDSAKKARILWNGTRTIVEFPRRWLATVSEKK